VPEFAPIRIYLDANVLFSASYSEANRFLEFWNLRCVVPVTSPYAIHEVRPHIVRPGHAARLDMLLAQTGVVRDAHPNTLPKELILVEKDRPILAAAIAARVDFLATGDKNHFQHLLAHPVLGVTIVLPATFLDRHRARLIL